MMDPCSPSKCFYGQCSGPELCGGCCRCIGGCLLQGEHAAALVEDFNAKYPDIHRLFAARGLGISVSEVTDEQRLLAKEHYFWERYGSHG